MVKPLKLKIQPDSSFPRELRDDVERPGVNEMPGHIFQPVYNPPDAMWT